MAQFVVAAKEDAKAAPAIMTHYPNDHIKVWDGLWLVSEESATAQQVCVKLGVPGGTLGSVLVASINGYYGFAGKNVWEWLAVKGTPAHGPNA